MNGATRAPARVRAGALTQVPAGGPAPGPAGLPSMPAGGPARMPLTAAESALHAVIEAVTAAGRPSARARAAVAGAYADLWACHRLGHAAVERPAAAVVARYLSPRLLLDGADGLAAALGARLHETGGPAARYRDQVRRLETAASAPGAAARTRDVAARLPALAAGDDRLARPVTAAPAQALPRALGSLVRVLEEERAELVVRATALTRPDGPGNDGGGPGPWALADRYALLTAAAACLDGWRVPGSPRLRRSGDRICLVAALHRLVIGLSRAVPTRAATEWRDEVYEVAVALGGPPAAGAGPTRSPFGRPAPALTAV